MNLRKGTPGGDKTPPRPEHFSYERTPPGCKPWTAWLACEPYWCIAHTFEDSPTKPCLSWITSGALTCHFCKPLHTPPWVGYVGLWRESDLKACLVVLREQNSELSEGLQFGDYVTVSRQAGEGNPIAIRKLLAQRPWKSRKPQRQGPADLSHSLITMWKIPVLTNWYECQASQSDNAVSQTRTVYVKPDGMPYGPMEQAAAGKAGAQKTNDPVALANYDKLLAQIRKRSALPEPSTNGNHKSEE